MSFRNIIKYERNSCRSPQSTLYGGSHLFKRRIKESNTRPSGQSFSFAMPSSQS